jgi:hypothetical protein
MTGIGKDPRHWPAHKGEVDRVIAFLRAIDAIVQKQQISCEEACIGLTQALAEVAYQTVGADGSSTLDLAVRNLTHALRLIEQRDQKGRVPLA